MEKGRRVRTVFRRLCLSIDKVAPGYNLESRLGGFCPMLTDICTVVVGLGLDSIDGGFGGLYLVIRSNKSRALRQKSEANWRATMERSD